MIGTSALWLAALTAFGAEAPRTGDKPLQRKEGRAAPDKPAKRPSAGNPDGQVEKIAAEFQVTREEVMGLREKGLAWNEVRALLAESRRSAVPIGEILKKREEAGSVPKSGRLKSRDPKGDRGIMGNEQKPD